MSVIFAQGDTLPTQDGAVTIAAVNVLFANVLSTVLGIAGLVLFIMLITGGFKYATSGGNPQALESAKKTLTYAILGMVLAAVAYLILVFIGVFTGANVTVFDINPGP